MYTPPAFVVDDTREIHAMIGADVADINGGSIDANT